MGKLNDQRGQAMMELALTVVILVMLVMGVIEFGRVWMLLNWATNAARDGARAAAVAPASDRDPTTHIITLAAKSQIETKVNNELNALASGLTGSLNESAVVNGVPVVQITITGRVNYMFNFVGATGFDVSRTATFRDEGR